MNPERSRKGILKAKKIIKIREQRVGNYSYRWGPAVSEQEKHILKNTRKPCSGDCCCNRRRNKWNDVKDSQQELKAKDDAKNQCKDCKCKIK